MLTRVDAASSTVGSRLLFTVVLFVHNKYMTPPSGTSPSPGDALSAARKRKGWSQQAAALRFCRIANRLNIPVAEIDSVKTMISRWENGKQVPDETNRRILRELYSRTDEELGLSADKLATPAAIELDELASRLRGSTRVDAAQIEMLDQQTHTLRLQDRRFGAAVLLDKMSAHIEVLQGLLKHVVLPEQRAELARVLADAGALAGWQALDAGNAKRAWDCFDIARQAGLESGDSALHAHALGEQAYAMLELGDPAGARELIEHAKTIGELPPLLQSWLAAAEGEFLANEGNIEGTLQAFDTAFSLLPEQPRDESLPFLSLDDTHLTRWRGSALARLGHPDAINDLTKALQFTEPTFVRALCGLHADLATAYAANGQPDQARQHIRIAKDLAQDVGSERLRRRIDSIRLPDTSE